MMRVRQEEKGRNKEGKEEYTYGILEITFMQNDAEYMFNNDS